MGSCPEFFRYPLGSSGGYSNCPYTVEGAKREATLVKALMLLTRNTGKGKGKTGSMGAKKDTADSPRARVIIKTLRASLKIEPRSLRQLLDGRRKTKPHTLPDTLIYRFSKQLEGRISPFVDSYDKIGTSGSCNNILKRG